MGNLIWKIREGFSEEVTTELKFCRSRRQVGEEKGEEHLKTAFEQFEDRAHANALGWARVGHD